ncbi:MAG TPA: hypothetical protein VLA00_07100 [Xanthobacteraceae bacterium]|nr:hypothetical protein [Xanthobacteraceae bacterium]
MTLASRLMLVTVLPILAALGIVGIAAFETRDRIDAAVEETRVAHLLGMLQATGQANLSIGLALDQIGLMQARIEREKAADQAIVAIDVFGANGRAIYSTDRGALGEPVGEDWVARIADSDLWRINAGGDATFGVRLENDLGKPAGGIAVTVADAERADRSLGWALLIASHAGLAAILVGLVGALLAFRFARRMTRPFSRAADILTAPAPPAGREGAFDAAARAARTAWQQADQAVEVGLARLEALDNVA